MSGQIESNDEVAGSDDGASGPASAPRSGTREGSRFGTYKVEELIGEGEMARVYRAYDERLRRPVALKVLSGATCADEGAVARFLREARVAARIRHPNVVDVFDVGVHDDVPFLVMELLSGHDLGARLRARGPVPEVGLVNIALPIVAALAVSHDAGVIHGDIKPSNIFLARRPDAGVELKLLDFGMSRVIQDDPGATSEVRARWVKSPLYTAPEALLDRETTVSSDQYSLGVVLYECATGAHPFVARSIMESVRRITHGRYRPVVEQAIHPSPGMAEIIGRMMKLDPEARFEDMRTLGHALLAIADERARVLWGDIFDPGASIGELEAPKSGRRHVYARRHALVQRLLGAAALGGAAVSALAWYWGVRHQPHSSLTSPAEVLHQPQLQVAKPALLPAPVQTATAPLPRIAALPAAAAKPEATLLSSDRSGADAPSPASVAEMPQGASDTKYPSRARAAFHPSVKASLPAAGAEEAASRAPADGADPGAAPTPSLAIEAQAPAGEGIEVDFGIDDDGRPSQPAPPDVGAAPTQPSNGRAGAKPERPGAGQAPATSGSGRGTNGALIFD